MGLIFVYVVQIIASFTRLIFLPYFPIWIFREHLVSAGAAALVVSIAVITARVGSLIFIKWVNHFHKKQVVICSAAILTFVYLIIFWAGLHDVTALTFWISAAALVGITISTTTLALNSLVSLNLSHQAHISGFSYLNIGLNIGGGLGPLLGGFVIALSPDYLPISAGFFALATFVVAFKLPWDKTSDSSNTVLNSKTFSLVSRPFMWLLLLNFLTIMCFAQFYSVFPAFAKDYIDSTWIGALFFISSLVIVVLQFPVTNIMLKISHNTSLIIGNVFFALGTAALWFIKTPFIIGCVVGVVILSIAELFFVPTYQTLSVKLYPKKPATALSFLNVVWGSSEFTATWIGLSLVGNQLGGYSFILPVSAALLGALLLSLVRIVFEDKAR